MKYFKNIKLSALIPHMLVTLIYPVIKTVTASGDKLLAFLDTLTVLSLFYLIFGVLYHLNLKGDFDRVQYTFHRSFNRTLNTFDVFRENKCAERETAFNYPLWLGLFYIAVCRIIAFILY
jgi:hypothetical protein